MAKLYMADENGKVYGEGDNKVTMLVNRRRFNLPNGAEYHVVTAEELTELKSKKQNPEDIPEGWKKAKGSCGYNVDGPVYGKMINRKASFAWKNPDGFWTLPIIGLMSCGGDSLKETEIDAIYHIANSGREDYDAYMGEKEFNEVMNDPVVLGRTIIPSVVTEDVGVSDTIKQK